MRPVPLRFVLRVTLTSLLLIRTSLAQPPEPTETAENREPIQLRLRLQPGQSFTFHLTTDQTSLQAIPGHASDMRQTASFSLVMRVLDVDKTGDITIATTYRSLRMKVQGEGFAIEYDSEQPPAKIDFQGKPAEAIFAIMLGALKGHAFTMKLSPNGQVRSVTGMEDMWVRMQQGIEQLELPEAAMRQQIVKSLEAMKTEFSDQSMKNFNTAQAVFPDKKVGIGESWQSSVATVDAATAGVAADKEVTTDKGKKKTIATNSQYTLKSRRDGIATLVTGSQILFNTPPAQTSPQAPPAPGGEVLTQTFNMSGTLATGKTTDIRK